MAGYKTCITSHASSRIAAYDRDFYLVVLNSDFSLIDVFEKHVKAILSGLSEEIMKGIRNRHELVRLINQNIGSNIIKHRELQEISRLTFSRKIGTSVEALRQYELGNNNISAARLFIIALILDIPMEQFFKQENGEPVIKNEHEQILMIIREFFQISSPPLAASIAGLIQILVAEIKSLTE